jgi:hypothetical protein
VEDSSRSRKSVAVLVHIVSFPTAPIASQTMILGKLDFQSFSAGD